MMEERKKLVYVNNGDIIDITTGEVIQTYRYDSIDLIMTNIILCDGDDRNSVFEFHGYQ